MGKYVSVINITAKHKIIQSKWKLNKVTLEKPTDLRMLHIKEQTGE